MWAMNLVGFFVLKSIFLLLKQAPYDN